MNALEGIRVLDLTRVLAGPWAAQALGDLGADVIKVERPGHGDDARLYGTHHLRAPDDEGPGEGGFYLSANRNKRSVSINLNHAEGQALIRRLAADVDVLIENFMVGTLARRGLDYATLSELNPRLVYCSLTGYGQDGPYSSRPGYDPLFQAQSGLMAASGVPDGQPGAGPMKTGPSILDVAGGQSAVMGILAALYHRDRVSGKGQFVDIALLDTAIAIQSHVVQNFLLSGEQPPRVGTGAYGGHPVRTFACTDGEIYIVAGNQNHYEALCDVLGRVDLVDDPRFGSVQDRFQHRGAWDAECEPIIRSWKRFELMDALIEAGVPCAVVYGYGDVFADPHVRHREIAVPVPHPLGPGGTVPMVANPVRLSATPPRYTRSAPRHGEHTREVLSEVLELDEAEITRLYEIGALG